MKNYSDSKSISVFLDKDLYSKDSIFKCIYWYSDKFTINVTSEKSNFFKVSFKINGNQLLENQQQIELLEKIQRDFIDYNLRDIVSKETKNVRDLLIAKAFSHGEYDEIPPGEISDPVGFEIK